MAVNNQNYTVLVDMLLAQGGTPRRELFEYPIRADDSRVLIAKAEGLADNILKLLNVEKDF